MLLPGSQFRLDLPNSRCGGSHMGCIHRRGFTFDSPLLLLRSCHFAGRLPPFWRIFRVQPTCLTKFYFNSTNIIYRHSKNIAQKRLLECTKTHGHCGSTRYALLRLYVKAIAYLLANNKGTRTLSQSDCQTANTWNVSVSNRIVIFTNLQFSSEHFFAISIDFCLARLIWTYVMWAFSNSLFHIFL